MKEFATVGYEYSELNEEAKETAKKWYLNNDSDRTDFLYEDIVTYLKETFENSDLDVCFSLGYCQGDGLNIYGTLNLYDFLEVWEAGEKEKRTLKYYIDTSLNHYIFEKNNRYCYSCKFIDRKYIDDFINEFSNELFYQSIKNINSALIEKFFNDIIDYFEKLDGEYEKSGYEYLYNIDDEEMEYICEANDYYFTKEGLFIQ